MTGADTVILPEPEPEPPTEPEPQITDREARALGIGPRRERRRKWPIVLGVLTTEQLAAVAGTCAVGLIPYAINDYTRGVSPLKCYEYLASGLAVLSTRLPAVDELARVNPHVVTADSSDLPARLHDLLRPVDDGTITDRVAAATGHGWDERGRILRDLLANEVLNGRQRS